MSVFFNSRKLVFFVFILVTCFVLGLSGFATKIKTEYSVTQFLPDNDSNIKADIEMKKYFFLEEYQPITLTITAKKSLLNINDMALLKQLTVDLGKMPGMKSASSIATFQTASQGEDSVNLGTLLDLTDSTNWEHRVLNDPLLSPTQISKDLKTVIVVLQISDYSILDKIKNEVLVQTQVVFPSTEIELGGVPIVQDEVSRLIKDEISKFLIIALILNCLSLLLVFKNFVGILISLLTVIMNIILAFFGMYVLDVSFNVLTTTVPVLITITSMAVATHIQIHYAKLLKQYAVNPVGQAVKDLFFANMLTSMTTAAGFLTLVGSNAELIREYGFTVAVLVLVSCLFTNIYTPMALAVLPEPKFRNWMIKRSEIPKLLVKWRFPICVFTLMFSVFFVFLGKNISWEIKLFDDLPKEHGVRQATLKFDQKLGGLVPYSLQLSSEQSDYWNEPEKVKALDILLKKWRTSENIGSIVSVPDLVRQNSKFFSDELPSERSVLAETYFMYSLAPENPLKHFLSANNKDLRVDFRFHDLESSKISQTIDLIHSESLAKFPELKITGTGLAKNGHLLLGSLSKSLVFGFWEAMAAIVFMLIFIFRSFFWALVSSVPNFLPAIGLFGLLGITLVPIKPTIAIVFSIALGIAFNNTIYVISYLLSDFKDKLNDQSIIKVMEREFFPCLISSVSLLCGFSVFLLSYFSLNKWFGIFLILSLVFGLFGDLIFLPAFLSYIFSFLRWRKNEKH